MPGPLGICWKDCTQSARRLVINHMSKGLSQKDACFLVTMGTRSNHARVRSTAHCLLHNFTKKLSGQTLTDEGSSSARSSHCRTASGRSDTGNSHHSSHLGFRGEAWNVGTCRTRHEQDQQGSGEKQCLCSSVAAALVHVWLSHGWALAL